MILGIFHQGSGLGNQLARYVMARVIALDKGYKFGMIGVDNFKGNSFMDLDFGEPIHESIYEHLKKTYTHEYAVFFDGDKEFSRFNELRTNNDQGVDIRGYDGRIKNIRSHTIIDGEFQGEEYYKHRLSEIREWLKVEPMEMPEDLCVINFRGGEYVGVRDLFLPKEYWDLAISEMRKINPKMRFVVHTDDVPTAQQFFPDFVCIRDIGVNWRSIRYAHYLIISNSSFAILPALLNENAKKIIAPMYWAGRNVGYWKMGQNKYERFTYL